ncbi:MAG: carboxypeptidase regulatory-like domain-containing protein [Flavobacteriales bacterium]|nr:carboxypeptidase regulatory-like domain-containing protein [Flavobacteriales bacterium]
MRINPCVENLSDMTPVNGGRYCSSCEKTIVDLTNKSNQEIRVLYDQNEGKLCGIVRPNQLHENRYYHPLKRFALALIIVFGTSLFVFANTSGFNQFRSKVYEELDNNALKMTIKGFVYGVGNPLVGAEVIAKVNGLEYVAYTDVNGAFTLDVPEINEGMIIIKFVHAGYLTQTRDFEYRDGMTHLFAGKVNLKLDQENCIKGKIAIEVEPEEEEPIMHTAGVIAMPPEPEEIEIQTKGEIQIPAAGGIGPMDDEIKFD